MSLMQLMCRPATDEDIQKPIIIRRSCGGNRTQMIGTNQPDYVLRMSWAYQEACGYKNPAKDNLRGIDYLMSKK